MNNTKYTVAGEVPVHKRVLNICGIVILFAAAIILGFVISLQTDPQREVISEAVKENTELKIRIRELEKENEQLGKIAAELQKNSSVQENENDETDGAVRDEEDTDDDAE